MSSFGIRAPRRGAAPGVETMAGHSDQGGAPARRSKDPERRARAGTVLTLALLAACAVGVTPAAAQGVQLAILPDAQPVAPGGTFTVSLEVTASGSAFNGFDVVVEYDPAVLTFVPLSPISLQRGAYMRSACVNSFHRFVADADTLSITDVLLCSGVALTGPGQIYTLKFIASATPQVTHLRFRSVNFYSGGLIVSPVWPADAAIGIGVPVDAAPGPRVSGGLALHAAPNPFRGQTAIEIFSPHEGPQRLVVQDVQGRRVRNFGGGWFAAGSRRLTWDGRDDAGRPLPAGIYRITLETRESRVAIRTALLR